MTPEGRVKARLRRALKPYKDRIFSFPIMPTPYTVAGLPDYFILLKGKTIGVEVKSPTGRLTPSQKRMRETLTERGSMYFVVRDKETIQDLIDTLEELLNENTQRIQGGSTLP